MPRRRYYRSARRRARSFLNTQNIMKYIRVGSLAAPAAYWALSPLGPQDKVRGAFRSYTGYDFGTGTWNWADLAAGWTPFIATSAITYGISKLNGIIRRI